MSADLREPKRRKLAHIGRTTIDIWVGEGDHRECFSIHEKLLTSRSDFFARAMDGSWKESKESVINLPTDSPALFSLYMHHLYTGKLATAPDEDTTESGGEHWVLAQLYVFAEKIQDSKCKNDILDAMVEHTFEGPQAKWPSCATIQTIYSGTAGPCPARRFLVDIYAVERTSAWCAKDQREKYPAEFVWDVMARMSERKPEPVRSNALSFGGTRYHEAVGGEAGQGEKTDSSGKLGLSAESDISS
ncbi:hypothetical protein BU16DRAFT_529031 [Lophium mytilinum]|uniref:BTB domain-containing protein n=1 Tax=Lophium mytilinum TaxID=390894 RepID=A0A6A6QKX1_9PEZI|nr:hypothetical protein BU16DRAFT_529031 [Lophium mytilinum]